MTEAPALSLPRVAPWRRLGEPSDIFYGVGQIAGQVFRDLPSLLLLFFMTNTLAIPPAWAGAAIFVPKLVFGVFCDLLVGKLSDGPGARRYRRWWLLLGAAGSPAAMLLLFNPPPGPPVLQTAYIAATFSLYMAVFAVMSVPYLAIAGTMSRDPRRRTVIMAWRLVFTAVGVVIAGCYAPIFIHSHGGGRAAYGTLAMILAVVCPASLIVAFFAAPKTGGAAAAVIEPPARRGAALRDIVAALADARFSSLLLANLAMLVASGMTYGSMIYFLIYGLRIADGLNRMGVITLIACAAIIAAQPLWVRLADRFGKRPIYVGGCLGYGATFILWGLFGRLGAQWSYLFAVLLGLSNSSWFLMGLSMLSDLAGEGPGGVQAAIWVAADKIGFALGGALLVGLVLSAFGFDPGAAMAGRAQPHSAVFGVFTAFCILPAALCLIGGLTLALSRTPRPGRG